MINNDENTTKQLVKTINKDQKLNEYKKLVECKQELENGNLAICQNLCILPDKISNQKFNEIISLNDFLKYQFLIRPFLGTPKDQKLILTFKESFEIIKLESVRMENIHVINSPQDMDYQLENNSIIVKSLNTATFYVLKIKFSNGDIINYVFL